MLKTLYVVGGAQRTPRGLSAGNQDWNGYEKGLMLQVETHNGSVSTCLDYVSPPEVVADENPGITFQAGTLRDGTLYLCTQTEILIYTLPDFQRVGYLSLPCFNDLHHVCPTPDGTLLVANAGLEMVLELTLGGEVRREWNVLGEEPWGRFSRELEYRKVSTKPHRAHPNYVFYVEGEPWVTRFHQGDAICLLDPTKRIKVSDERIHDGVVHQGMVYFTSVDGKVIVANPHTQQVEDIIDLNRMHAEGTLLGWCRSVLPDEGRLWVGYSRIRPTKLRENVTWVMRGFKRVEPTRIACYDLGMRQCVREFNLEPVGLGAVYSIFPAA